MLAKAGEADRHIRTKMVGTDEPMLCRCCIFMYYINSRNIYLLERGRQGRPQDDDCISCYLLPFHLACVYFQRSSDDDDMSFLHVFIGKCSCLPAFYLHVVCTQRMELGMDRHSELKGDNHDLGTREVPELSSRFGRRLMRQ